MIESALANARQTDEGVDIDGLYVSICQVDSGPNKHLRRWRPRAMGRATQVTKGVSHIAITLTDVAPPKKAHAGRKPAEANAPAETASADAGTEG